jgi:hypothetical protein
MSELKNDRFLRALLRQPLAPEQPALLALSRLLVRAPGQLRSEQISASSLPVCPMLRPGFPGGKRLWNRQKETFRRGLYAAKSNGSRTHKAFLRRIAAAV